MVRLLELCDYSNQFWRSRGFIRCAAPLEARMNWPQRLQAPLWKVKCFLMYVAAYLWRRLLFRTTFIAITGSVGKTTAKECLAAIMSSRFPTASTWANQNDESGVPRSILRVRPWHRFAVLEVAASGRGLMRRSAPLVSPDVALVLTVARTHMRSHKTLESVAAEKFELLKALRPGGTAVLNADSSWVAAMARAANAKWSGSAAQRCRISGLMRYLPAGRNA